MLLEVKTLDSIIVPCELRIAESPERLGHSELIFVLKGLPSAASCQIFAQNWFPMYENRGDAVVRLDGFQRILRHEHKIGNPARLDCPDLRFQFELPRVVDRSRTENLFQRHSRLLQLFHLQKPA